MSYRILLGLLVGIAFSCDDLDDFRTRDDEVFEGTVAGSETGDEGSFIRTGFAVGTRLELTFNPDFSLQSDEEIAPGTISTFEPGVEDDDEVFQDTALDVIRALAHDPLMKYSFPGGGRIRNYIFSALPCGAIRSAFVFVSLMEDKDIEVRIIAPRAPRVNSECDVRIIAPGVEIEQSEELEESECKVRTIAPGEQSQIESDYASDRELFGVFRLKRVSR